MCPREKVWASLIEEEESKSCVAVGDPVFLREEERSKSCVVLRVHDATGCDEVMADEPEGTDTIL